MGLPQVLGVGVFQSKYFGDRPLYLNEGREFYEFLGNRKLIGPKSVFALLRPWKLWSDFKVYFSRDPTTHDRAPKPDLHQITMRIYLNNLSPFSLSFVALDARGLENGSRTRKLRAIMQAKGWSREAFLSLALATATV